MPSWKWNSDAECAIWRSICAPNSWHASDGVTPTTHPDSLYWFVRKCWGTDAYFARRIGESRWFQDRVHRPYLHWLQFHILAWMRARREGTEDQYFIASIIPRGFGKTVCSTKAASIWMSLADADLSVLLYSAVSNLAKDIHEAIQNILDGSDRNSWFCWLYGNWYDSTRKWKKEESIHKYRVTTNLSEPSFDTSGTDIGATGYHHDVHSVDDPISKNKLREGGNYMTSVHIGVDALYNALKPNGLMMLSLTRYLDDDVAGRHLKVEGVADWTGMKNPNRVMFDRVDFGEGTWHVYFLQAEDESGKAVLPEVYNEAKIAAHKRRDPEDFASQMQNNPGSGEHTPLLEWQLRDCFVDYNDLNFIVPALEASVHIDTAFKKKENIGKGDSSAIVVFLHDERPNGLIYLDTDLLRASNEWRSDDFNDVLIKEVLIPLRKRGIRVKCITDETEGMGKAGVYQGQLRSLLSGAGFNIRIHTIPRQGTRKRQRIRTAAGYYVEGYVRIFLHKRKTLAPDGRETLDWVEPPVFRTFMNQMLRIDAVDHDDIADAAADVFVEEPRIWRRPIPVSQNHAAEEGAFPVSPGEDANWSANERVFGKKLVEEMQELEEERERERWTEWEPSEQAIR